MKPDAYMPLYGNDFFNATDAMSDECFRCYFRVVWHYWHHNHCKGLRDDKDALRRICHADKEQWDDLYAQIFDNDQFFTLGEDGLWHQKRTAEEWAKSSEQYKKVLDRAQAGAAARWGTSRKALPRHNRNW